MQQDDMSQNKLTIGVIKQHLDKNILTLTMSNPNQKECD